ncbi:hypothetical protein EsDP_00003370 [Epichloe bromicola]|uniref:Uncharacterized protein n=1 Tax=Epichloe bromicola TaxID=79588 RepID=A0ABQ0CNJ0_9HYPO
MISARVIVALAGLASAFQGASFFEAAPANSLPGLSRDSSFEGLSARAEQCLAGQVACGTGFCMAEGGTCCDGIQGTYCNPGLYCSAQGCCPHGKVCEGSPPGGCAAGKRQCGIVCIPDTSACCSSDKGCDSPMMCGTDGMCVGPSTPSREITTPGPASTSPGSAASATRSPRQTDSSPASTSPGVAASATRSPTRTYSSPASASLGVAASATRSLTRTDSSPAKATGDAGRGGDDGNGNGDINGNTNRGGNGSTQDEKKTPVGVIVGSVVGGLAGLALVGLGITLLLRHNRKQEDAVQTQTFQQRPPPPMQQRPQPSPYRPGASSPAQGTGFPPPQPSPAPPPQRVYTAYSPSMAAAMASSPTATYSTGPRTVAPSPSPIPAPPPPAPRHLGAAKPNDDHRGQIHELA